MVLEGYCLSACSGDFDTLTEKVAATDQSFSFIYTIEWEMPYFNMGSTFDYAEMASLMLPRLFMGQRDTTTASAETNGWRVNMPRRDGCTRNSD
jgi:hypothetical protein